MSAPIQNQRLQNLVIQPATTTQTPPAAPETGKESFAALLDDRLKVSGHAQTRLQSRNIDMNRDQWERVIGGVEKAAQKGAKESLVLLDEVALVVSVKNRTVITAVEKEKLKENVFTNIDSAVIV